MKCPQCQKENPEGNKFCRECGAKLVTVCVQCGCECPPEDKFCGKCGHDLSSSVALPKNQMVDGIAHRWFDRGRSESRV